MKFPLNRRVPAFTVLELTVVISISAILIMGVYYSFHFFSQLYQKFSTQLSATEQLYRFEKQLRKDFQEASYVQAAGRQLRMVYHEKSVEYTFYQDYLLREQAFRKDTVFLGVLRFNAAETENMEGEKLTEMVQIGLTDQEGEEISLYLSRAYTPEFLLNKIKE